MASTPRPSLIRIFIDTSVVFAAMLSERGLARDLMLASARGECEVALSTLVILETRRNLTNKAPRALPYFEDFLARELFQLADPPPDLVRHVAATIVLKDAPIVAGAIHAGVQAVATYDRKHLLSQAALIQANFAIIVATPESILANL
jgi:predicted nucleic acid-binding protein